VSYETIITVIAIVIHYLGSVHLELGIGNGEKANSIELINNSSVGLGSVNFV